MPIFLVPLLIAGSGAVVGGVAVASVSHVSSDIKGTVQWGVAGGVLFLIAKYKRWL